ncbi:DegV family protein [Ureibacillus sp. NPDC094379]
MTEKIAWVTDTAALLDEEFIKKNHIYEVPIVVIFEEGPYREKVELKISEFYDKLRTAKKLPTTSQPVFGELVELYERLKADGYTCAIAVHPSSKLSNTLESSAAAAKQVGFPIYAIDSKMISYPMMKLLEEGIKLEKDGVSTADIVRHLEKIANQAVLCGIPSNLKQLHKSGRVPGIAAVIGNLIQLKLILYFEDGQVTLKEKVRTLKRAKEYVVSLLNEDLKNSKIPEVAIIHCNNETDALKWQIELQSQFPSISFVIYPLSPAIAVHAGEGTTGLSWMKI